MNQINQVFLLTFLVIGTGFLLKKFKIISEKEGKIISKFMLHTTFPALMFVSSASIKFNSNLLAIPLVCFFTGTLMILTGWFVFTKYPSKLRGVLMLGFGATNVGFFGFPLVEGLFGKEALIYLVMYDIGNTALGFGLAYPIGKYFADDTSTKIDWNAILKKVFTLPPLLGMLFGLAVNILNIELPEIFFVFMNFLAKGNAPIGLLLLGIYLSFNLDKKQIMGISKVLAIRYIFGLFVLIVLYYFLPNSTYKSVVMICAILPLGIMIIPFSDELNYDSRIAGTLANTSLLISFILIWLLMALI
jgi:malate permease and related proteins